MARQIEKRRIEALTHAIQRRAGAILRLDAEQRNWLAAWREHQRHYLASFETQDGYFGALIETDYIDPNPVRRDIRSIIYECDHVILAVDTEATASEKYRRLLERQ